MKDVEEDAGKDVEKTGRALRAYDRIEPYERRRARGQE